MATEPPVLSEHSGEPPQPREPVFNFPAPITLSILLIIGLYVLPAYLLPADLSEAFVISLAFSPVRYVYPLTGQNLEWLWTPVTYSLLHGGWEHLLFNALWLAAFGTPVVRRIGTTRFVLFWIVSAVAAAILHAVLNWGEVTLLIGASGVISGLMGAACRFAFPASGRAYNPQFGHLYPRQSILSAFGNRTVAIFIAIWLFGNLVIGLGIPLFGDLGGAIAWDAHLGGFAFGFFCFALFDPWEKPAR
ncbi:rhomboid family intramembrane serine protease [Rhizobiaceae bacterium BDR2-2]|uniref:Rhomboid family intramembrane serine protease n=1 Tax=Ectorhizobium quercum TaxID=2965071 RepID=A0AAE3N097_9HYPH|nr:rhomboid family intramembrane serine protease [Ectorhizobium quercum]MCX8997731.1 rhomboid family intramembrane serine protease [Ectorhizobium quercum]